ncbi:MAG: aminotransferase class I/II-fold pyridoxal phosphate-dependent enzyme [archaeon]
MKKVIPASRTLGVKHANRDLVPVAEQVEASGKKVLYLNIGDPIVFDFRAPESIWQSIEQHKRECEGYTNAIGSNGARQAIADYAKRGGINGVTKDDVISFVGGNEAIILSMQALLNPGENVLLPGPGYPVYTGEMSFLECPLNVYQLDEENDWQLDVDSIRKNVNKKTKAIVIINPNNPTGSVLSRKNLSELVNIAGEFDLPILADETYDQILYDGTEFVPLAGVSKDVPVLSLGSISKTHLVPGFRAGWIYRKDPKGALDDYFEAMHRLCRLRLSNAGIGQVAIEAALNGEQNHVKEMVAKLKKRRDLTFKRLNEIHGLSCVKPKGAFYAFPRINLPIKSDKEFVIDLLKETGVLVVHGEGSGQKEGTHHFRIVFLPPEETLSEAFNRIEGYIKKKFK